MEKSKLHIEFVPLTTAIDPSFWNRLTTLKLDVDKLEENEHHIWGYVYNLNTTHHHSLLQLDSTCFNKLPDSETICVRFHGTLINKNTIESFKECNKNDLINQQGKRLWENITNGTALEQPSLLNLFLALTFADLKKYQYYYWIAYPVSSRLSIELNCKNQIGNLFSEKQLETLLDGYRKLDVHQRSFFLLEKRGEDIILHTHSSKLKQISASNYTDYFFVFHDTSQSQSYPGTMLRNYVLFILFYCGFLQGKDVNFISLRPKTLGSKITCKESLIFNFKLPFCDNEADNVVNKLVDEWLGWEKNERNKFGPKMVNLRASMDPKVLMETAVDLNLKLMKWQLVPDIDLDKIKNSRYLILGSGTLGCSVARSLLGWGARKISFVDNSTVSYSNPVRQSLFNYEDAVSGKSKAAAAADNLKLIFPGVESHGHHLTIPMPDHPVGESLKHKTETEIFDLIKLIQEHDIIFILTDSRESRWLPTLLGSFYNKLVINAALGFDTYLVMRHGASRIIDQSIDIPKGFKFINGHELGCYFCSDVTAPGNSLKERTLDQQCTVTRPGISAIAGAVAVELAISVLQHPYGVNCPAFYKTQDDGELFRKDECILGIVPHSIRGYLSSFNNMLPASHKFNQCTACSEDVLSEYKQHGIKFLFKVFDSSKYLTSLLKLDVIHQVDDISSYSEDESI